MDYTENEAFKIRYTITILQLCLWGNDFFYFSTIFYQFSKRYACVLLKKEIELNFPYAFANIVFLVLPLDLFIILFTLQAASAAIRVCCMFVFHCC